MRECGCYSTTTLAQPRRPCRPRHPYAVPRTLFECVCTRRRNCIGQLSPSSEYAPAARQINPNTSAIILRLVALCVWRVDPAPNDPVLLAAKDGAAGGGCALMRTLGGFSRRNSNGRDRIRCSVTQIFRYRLTRRLRAGAPSPTTIPPSHVAARSKRARRNVALHFWSQRHVLSTQRNFLSAGRAFDRDQRMLELWNNWYETLASMEALATVIVIVVVAAGVITLAESRR
jgi:hypothetical protein